MIEDILASIRDARKKIADAGGEQPKWAYLVGQPRELAWFLKKWPEVPGQLGVEIKADPLLSPLGYVFLMSRMPSPRAPLFEWRAGDLLAIKLPEESASMLTETQHTGEAPA